MKRAIEGFHRDDEGHPVAELRCGHGQHVRHEPPFHERAWVLSEEGRAAKLGVELDCARCDRREIPEGYAESRRTPVFDAESLPRGLRSRHTTAPGVWAEIHVTAGRLAYRIHEPFHSVEWIEAGSVGVVLPEVEHEVHPDGEVELYVAFLRRAGS